MFDMSNVQQLIEKAHGLIDELGFKFNGDGSVTIRIVRSGDKKENVQTYSRGEDISKKLTEQIMGTLFG